MDNIFSTNRYIIVRRTMLAASLIATMATAPLAMADTADGNANDNAMTLQAVAMAPATPSAQDAQAPVRAMSRRAARHLRKAEHALLLGMADYQVFLGPDSQAFRSGELFASTRH